MKRESFSDQNVLADIFGRNPFLESLGVYIAYLDMPGKMAYSPLNSIPLNQVSLAQRDDLMVLRKQHFVCTTTALNIADKMQIVLRENYVARNPMNPAVRKRAMEIAMLRDADPDKLAWFPNFASGMVITGITGLGKSTIAERYLHLLPYQVMEYTAGEIPGYVALKQIVWMRVDMSSDGSRGGLLMGILAEVDRLIGTDYYGQYSGAKLRIDTLMLRVSIILSSHFCGMLVIEEIQPDNFGNSVHAHQHATFFLRLLNFGIPIVLIGNPLGFEALDIHSQVMRRFTSGGKFDLHPAPSACDFDWKSYLVPGIWAFDVMPKPTVLCDRIRATLYKFSGGISDFLVTIRIESQRIALRLRSESVTVAHIEQAFNGSNISANHNLIRGFASKDAGLLSGYKDIPHEYYSRLWKRDKPDDPADTSLVGKKSAASKEKSATAAPTAPSMPSDPTTSAPPKPAPAKSSVAQKEAQFRSQQTRGDNREKKVKTLNTTLPKDDMRQDGTRNAMLTKMQELKKQLG